ncbi:right-handed parallel beta-helix repeat-containing protein [Microbacteriaceae bacterium VKM Ac-2855]|nr:right-handed parallel beta-helix repeat-containing protein [Microbacteriaceae bacterium VKM Ac-2855]
MIGLRAVRTLVATAVVVAIGALTPVPATGSDAIGPPTRALGGPRLTVAVPALPLPSGAVADGARPRRLLVGEGLAYPSIQAAVDAARSGDTVAITPGRYVENVTVDGRAIDLVGLGDPASIVLTAPAGRSPLMIQHVPAADDSRMRVSGFTITGGHSPDGQGGGITIAFDANPVIQRMRIVGNHSEVHGGGILVYDGSSPLLIDNTISDNTAGVFGGGVFAVKYSSPAIVGNTFEGNAVTGAQILNGGSSGGAIYLENDIRLPEVASRPVVARNLIRANTAQFAGGGVMVRVGVDATIVDNTIVDNAAAYGGGIHLESATSTMTVSGNRILRNRAVVDPLFEGSGFGGGIAVYDHSEPTIRDNELAGNSASAGGAGVSIAEGAVVRLTGNRIRANTVTGALAASGGGVYAAHARLRMSGNDVTGNTALVGGGVALLDGARAVITGDIIRANRSSTPRGGGGVYVRDAVAEATLEANLISDNAGAQIFDEHARARLRDNVVSGGEAYFSYASGTVTLISEVGSLSAARARGNVDSLAEAPATVRGGLRYSSVSTPGATERIAVHSCGACNETSMLRE